MIETQNLTMRYGSVVALQDATFSVPKGEIVGYLGPNGAGKSTTLKILTTTLYPSGGAARICGHDVKREPDEVRRRIGYLPEIPPVYPDMEVGAYLRFVGKARGLSGTELRKRTNWVLDKVDLRPMFRRPIGQLSKGYRQRTALAQALIHDPEVVILDEPTSGLDPHQILEIRSLVNELAQDKTVIFSTHILQEVQAVSDRVIIINRGHLVADGTIDQLARRAQEGSRAEVALVRPEGDVAAALRSAAGVKSVRPTSEKGKVVRFEVTGPRDHDLLSPLSEVIKRNGWELRELKDKPYTLEETFLRLTEAEGVTLKGGVA